MFAGNEKISLHQVTCLMFADWIAKLLLLLPRAGKSLQGWNDIAAIALGSVWAAAYLLLLSGLSGHISGSFTNFMKERLGKYAAYLAGAVFLAYLLINQTYLSRLTGRICRMFLLPETSETLIAVGVLLAGAATAVGSSQKRGRAAECLSYLIAAALFLMIAASAGSVRAEHFSLPEHAEGIQILCRSGTVFAGFAGITLILYEMPHVGWDGKSRRKALFMGFGFTCLFLLASFIVLLGTFGAKSLLRLPWPILTLMSSMDLPGGFLQRWDAVFLAVLLFSLLIASGTCSHYMKRILGELLPGRKTGNLQAAAFLAAAAAVLLTGNFETAAALFSGWALRCTVPLTAAVPVILYVLERIKKKCGS